MLKGNESVGTLYEEATIQANDIVPSIEHCAVAHKVFEDGDCLGSSKLPTADSPICVRFKNE